MTQSKISVPDCKTLQLKLANQVSSKAEFSFSKLKYVAGADVSYERRATDGFAAIVVCKFPGLEVVEISGARGKIDFPYVPGYLSFRELPLLEKAWNGLKQKPEVLVCDGHGLAHPRRFGLASHAEVQFNVPTIGCGKSRLIGNHDELKSNRGAMVPLLDRGERIGTVLRTRDRVRPLYISIGHRMTLRQAEKLILKLCLKYRQPEVIRLAHK